MLVWQRLFATSAPQRGRPKAVSEPANGTNNNNNDNSNDNMNWSLWKTVDNDAKCFGEGQVTGLVNNETSYFA